MPAKPGNHRCLYAKFALLALLLFFPSENSAAQTDEYTLKAAFLERFTRFIEWPHTTSVADTSEPFIISILGENPFHTKLENLYARHAIKNKRVLIRYIDDLEEIAGTNLLFITRSMHAEIAGILQSLADKPILTIGDSEGFAESGVHINFYLAGASIRFEINQTALHRANLRTSYQLLKLARIIDVEGEKQ